MIAHYLPRFPGGGRVKAIYWLVVLLALEPARLVHQVGEDGVTVVHSLQSLPEESQVYAPARPIVAFDIIPQEADPVTHTRLQRVFHVQFLRGRGRSPGNFDWPQKQLRAVGGIQSMSAVRVVEADLDVVRAGRRGGQQFDLSLISHRLSRLPGVGGVAAPTGPSCLLSPDVVDAVDDLQVDGVIPFHLSQSLPIQVDPQFIKRLLRVGHQVVTEQAHLVAQIDPPLVLAEGISLRQRSGHLVYPGVFDPAPAHGILRFQRAKEADWLLRIKVRRPLHLVDVKHGVIWLVPEDAGPGQGRGLAREVGGKTLPPVIRGRRKVCRLFLFIQVAGGVAQVLSPADQNCLSGPRASSQKRVVVGKIGRVMGQAETGLQNQTGATEYTENTERISFNLCELRALCGFTF